MPNVTIYTTFMCPYCYRAKKLLADKDIAFQEIDVTASPAKRQQMTELAGSHTVPQIFVDDRHVGNSDTLEELEAKGQLDNILSGAS